MDYKIVSFLLCTSVYLPTISFCQDRGYFIGYVVLNGGDTLHGKIKTYEMEDDVRSFEVVKFLKDGVKVEFQPSQLVSYQVLDYYYETREVGEKHPRLVFSRVMVKGYCTMYIVGMRASPSYSAMGQAMPGISRTTYLQRQGEEPYPVNFTLLKQGKDLYFIDNVQLTYDIRNKKYRPEQMEEIVKRYNREWEEAQNEGK